MHKLAYYEIINAIGIDNIITDDDKLGPYLNNVSDFKPKLISAVVKPENKQQIVDLVLIANKWKLSLYPISTGMNWGLGSKLPIVDSCIVIDLAKLNKIQHVCDRYRYAVIEPGVIQQQLSDHLSQTGSSSILNVTGSSTKSSIIGNVLDRGTGIFGPRVCLGVEVVLGTGEVVQIGEWQNRSYSLPAHAGPNLHDLFIQSNLGIVTSMVVELMPRLNNFTHVDFYVTEESFPKLIEEVRELRSLGVLNNNIKIEDIFDPRIKLYLSNINLEKNMWVGHTILTGPDEMIKAQEIIIKQRLGPLCKEILFYDKNEACKDKYAEQYLDNCFKLYEGLPLDCNLNGILSKEHMNVQSINHNLDEPWLKLGFLSVMFAFPLESVVLLQSKDIVAQLTRKYNIDSYCNFATIGTYALSGFFPIYFNRQDKAESQRAHAMKQELYSKFLNLGIYPIRIDIDEMQNVVNISTNKHWQLIKSIKKSIDPNNVIAPGRYCPL